MEKKVCNKCKKEVDVRFFYFGKDVCKNCFKVNLKSNDEKCFKKALREIDLPFISEVWDIVKNTPVDTLTIEYMKILGLPQYKSVRNSGYIEGSMISENFMEGVILNLKNEITSLNNKISNARNNGDYGTYKNLINAYSEILRLIERYDWRQMHSEYYKDGKKQVAVWEQNSSMIVRNHKVWDVKE